MTHQPATNLASAICLGVTGNAGYVRLGYKKTQQIPSENVQHPINGDVFQSATPKNMSPDGILWGGGQKEV